MSPQDLVNIRVEVRESAGGWEQPILVTHPDPETARRYAVLICDAIRSRVGKPARATVGDNPPESGKWAEGEVVYDRS